MYKITHDDLAHAGLKVDVTDPRAIKMFNLGKEVPISVIDEDDGVFDASDYIIFYGIANKDVYTSQNIYWLKAGKTQGKRMGSKNGDISGTPPIPEYFPDTMHVELDSYYWQTIPFGAGHDHWFWGESYTMKEARDYPVALNNLANVPGTATIQVRMKGRTNDTQINPDHHTRIYLNGAQIDDQRWDGQAIFDHRVNIPHASLEEGTNTVRVESVGDTSAAADLVLLNWIEVGYFDTYQAEDDSLLFKAPKSGVFRFEVQKFTSNDIEVFDITDPAHPLRIINTTVKKKKGLYTLLFKDKAKAKTRYLALTPNRHKKPETIVTDQPSDWKSPNRGADYVIITHDAFYNGAQKLARYRKSKGLRTVVVKVCDIYDEFNYGIFHPKAIRDFLSYAYQNWIQPAPTYVVLLGDGCQDYKDNYHTGSINYVPSQIIGTEILGETPTDNWFVCVSGDDILPDMFVGRLSTQSASQAYDIVNKIVAYDRKPPEGDRTQHVLLVADDDDAVFTDTCEVIAGLFPDDFTFDRVYVANYTSGLPVDDIIQSVNNGDYFINYAGHGAVDRWGLWNNKPSFGVGDLPSLNNAHKLAVVTVADCLNGFFPGFQTRFSLAEGFQRLPKKGAIAVWAPTGLSFPIYHQILMREFYKRIIQNKKTELGVTTTAAKLSMYPLDNYWDELIETYILFGDPATREDISSIE